LIYLLGSSVPRLRFLGSADSQGVPRWWCGCSVCSEARSTGHNARTRPSALIESETERILIDAAPELRLQLSQAGISDIDAVLISHAHSDHVLGLGDVADKARWTGKVTPIYAPEEVLPQVQARFPYLRQGNYAKLTPFYALEQTIRSFAGYQVSAYKVPHGFNGFSYGFRFDKLEASWAYVSDSIGLKDLAPWSKLDLLVLGTSFYHEQAPYQGRSVYDVLEAVELLKQLKPKETIFTHLGHGIDSRKPSPEGCRYASDGMIIQLPSSTLGLHG
jgi:phosphoribosyl 1,2-cyclic phosphate phosphodiesterase